MSLIAALGLLPAQITAPRALVVGGGAGELATTLNTWFKNWTVDVVEPDPTVVHLARRHFGFDPPVYREGVRVHAGGAGYERVRLLELDGLGWLRQVPAHERYDFVVLDAFDTSDRGVTGMPHAFSTPEFVDALASSVRAHGVVAGQLFPSDAEAAAFRLQAEGRFASSFLFGHHKLRGLSQWWSYGQRVLVLADRRAAAAAPGTSGKLSPVPLGDPAPISPHISPHLPISVPLGDPACANATRELHRFAASSSALSLRHGMPVDLGSLVRGRFYEHRAEPREGAAGMSRAGGVDTLRAGRSCVQASARGIQQDARMEVLPGA